MGDSDWPGRVFPSFFFFFFQKKVLSSDSTGPPGERTERNYSEKRDWMEVGMKREKSIYAEMKH